MSHIKLIWDFRGVDAEGLARHHAQHLEQFAQREALEETTWGAEAVSEKHWLAWMTVPEEKMIVVRDALRPHRGQHAE